MRKAPLIAGIVVVLATLFFLGWRHSRAIMPPPAVPVGSIVQPESHPASPSRFQEIQQSPRDTIVNAPEEATKECVQVWNAIRTLNIGESFAMPTQKENRLPKSGACVPPTEDLKVAQEGYAQSCGQLGKLYTPGMKPEQWAQALNGSGCLLNTILYRAKVANWLEKGKPLNQISDIKTLGDMLFAQMLQDPGGAAAVADRILDLEPGLTDVRKLAAMARLFDANVKAEAKPNDPLWNRADDALADARKRLPNDSTLAEMEVVNLIQRYNDPGRIHSALEQIRESNPETYAYYRAWSEYKANNREGAMQILKESNIKNPRFQQTIESISKGAEHPFQANLNFPLDLLTGKIPNPPAE